MKKKWIEFFLPGFLWMPIVAGVRIIRSFLSAPRATLRQMRGHPVLFGLMGLSLAAGAFLTVWGMGHRTLSPLNDVVTYNEGVRGSYLYPAETNPAAYCYEDGMYWGGGQYYCPTQEEIAKIFLDRRMRNLELKDKFAKLAQDAKDPRISSRALYNMGTAYLRDAIDFKDPQSLEDAILALQNSLRNDPSYKDSFDDNSMTLAQDKRINLEIALFVQDALQRGAGTGDRDGKEGDEKGESGFGAGKSNSGREP